MDDVNARRGGPDTLGGVTDLFVRLQPRGRRTAVVGERAGRIVIAVTAPPVDGRANAALCTFLADAASVPKGAVRVIRGESSRDKLVRVEGVELEPLRRALGLETG